MNSTGLGGKTVEFRVGSVLWNSCRSTEWPLVAASSVLVVDLCNLSCFKFSYSFLLLAKVCGAAPPTFLLLQNNVHKVIK